MKIKMTGTILKNLLFKNISATDITIMLECLNALTQTYKKGELIFMAGESKPLLGILLEGKAQVIKENIAGDSMIISSLEKGDLFGETYACMGLETIPVSVAALEDSLILYIDAGKITHRCESSCPFHEQLISNLLRILAMKNAGMNLKMAYLMHKTIRSRLEAYFYDQIEHQKSSTFTLPYNRNELADYLCIDRSAMCRELSNMKKEKLLDYEGRIIKWLETYL